MELLKDFIDLFLHLDKHLSEVIQHYGTGTYLILFLIVFCETGLVVTPFLPGDSLLFAAGTFAGLGDLDVGLVFTILCAASILGDSSNYWVGRLIGRKAFQSRFIKQEHLLKTRGLLRPARPQDHHSGQIPSHSPDIRAIRRRGRGDAIHPGSLRSAS